MSTRTIRESVRVVAQEMMEAEVSDLIGAKLGERSEDRATHRNGYRPRCCDTRAGEVELQIPKLRHGSYTPSFLQPRKRVRLLDDRDERLYVCASRRGASRVSGCGSPRARSAGCAGRTTR